MQRRHPAEIKFRSLWHTGCQSTIIVKVKVKNVSQMATKQYGCSNKLSGWTKTKDLFTVSLFSLPVLSLFYSLISPLLICHCALSARRAH